jgi:hypothetical protein
VSENEFNGVDETPDKATSRAIKKSLIMIEGPPPPLLEESLEALRPQPPPLLK